MTNNGGPGYVMADVKAQQLLCHDFDQECRAFDSVGWWHTHPHGIGLFYGSTDRDNQATWTDPNSVGIVLDPQLDGEGLKVFRGPKSEPLTCMSDNHVIAALRTKMAPRPAPAATLASRPRVWAPKEKANQRRQTLRRFDLRLGELLAVALSAIALFVAVTALYDAAAPPQITVLPAPVYLAVDREAESERPAPSPAPAERTTDFVAPATTVAVASAKEMQSEPDDSHGELVDGPGHASPENQCGRSQDPASQDNPLPLPSNEEQRVEPTAPFGSGPQMPGIHSLLESR